MDQVEFPKNIMQLIPSQLEGRKFRVKVDNEIYTPRRPEAGVTQGAVLSPKLFSIYTADIPKPNYLLDRTIMVLYADNTAIAYQCRHPTWVVRRLQTHQIIWQSGLQTGK